MKKKITSTLHVLIPKSLGILLYRIAYLLVKLLYYVFYMSVEVWPSHSYKLGTLEPFVSSIDLTVLVVSSMTPKQIRRLSRFHKTLQKWITVLGECNIYEHESLPLALACINPYELSQDPVMIQCGRDYRIPLPMGEPDSTAKICFLLRSLHADFHRLVQRPELLRRKWEGHFQMVFHHSAPETLNVRAILFEISNLVPPEQQEAFRSDMEAYFFTDIESITGYPWILSVDPRQFVYSKVPMPSLNPLQEALFLKEVQWDIFLALTRHYNFDDPKKLLEQLKASEQLTEKLQIKSDLLFSQLKSAQALIKSPSETDL